MSECTVYLGAACAFRTASSDSPFASKSCSCAVITFIAGRHVSEECDRDSPVSTGTWVGVSVCRQ